MYNNSKKSLTRKLKTYSITSPLYGLIVAVLTHTPTAQIFIIPAFTVGIIQLLIMADLKNTSFAVIVSLTVF